MVEILSDENFNDRVLTGLTALHPAIDLLKAKDVGLASAPDDVILEWAASRGRFVLTHDKNTMVPAANRRLADDSPMPGLTYVPLRMAVGLAIGDLELLLTSTEAELQGRVHFLPIRR